MTLSPELLRILVCPKCKSTLEHRAGPPESLVCRTCRLVYAVQDGIPVMLIDEARPLDDAGFPDGSIPEGHIPEGHIPEEHNPPA